MINKAINRLGYTSDWFDLGIITDELVLSQYKQINHSKDSNAEHYRHKSFTQFLDTQTQLSDATIEGILQLIDNGPDRCDLHVQRVTALIYSGLLTDSQFQQLSQYKQILEDPIHKIYTITKLIRTIKKHGLDNYFDQVVAIKDSVLHEFVLTRKDLNRSHVLWFSQYGCNKKVRSCAKKILTS